MSDHIDELVDDAAAALREATAEAASPEQAAQTRARMLATHRRSREESSRAVVWLSAAAALVFVLGGSTAWAYWTGRLHAWVGHSPTPTIETSVPTEQPTEPTTHVAPIVAPPASALVAPPEPTTVITASQDREVSAQEATVARQDDLQEEEEETTTTTPTRPAVDPRERAAYRAAHVLHFDAHNPAGAIDAWDDYLAAYPSGRFALEARYNRALCLVRLGRMSEARTALTPFVEGTHNGYRQREAIELVQALDAQ